jgi:hypothetical protein
MATKAHREVVMKQRKFWPYVLVLQLFIIISIFLFALPVILHPHRELIGWISYDWPFFLGGLFGAALALTILSGMD